MLLYDVHKNNKGFTLIEIITVVIIIGVLASIAAPNLLGMLNQARVKEGMNQIEGAIKETQRLAMRRGKTCKIKFVEKTIDGKSRETINVVESTDAGEAGADYSGCLLSERILPAGVLVDSALAKIGFSGKGNTIDDSAKTIDNGEGTIVITHDGTNTQKCVQIEGLLGNVVSGDYDDTATPKCQAK